MKLLNKKKLLISAAIVFVLILIFRFFDNSESSIRPKSSPVIDAVYALGTVKSDSSVNIRFGMNSVITRFYVKEGDSVSKNSPLLTTDSSVTFRSPIPGIVTGKHFNENEIVPSGQAVLTITDMKSLYVRLSLDQESIIQVKKGMKADISFENLRDTKVSGEVEAIYQSGGEFVVRIKVPDMPEMVLPEMTCDTAIILRENPSGILIPATAVVNGKVKIKRKGKIEQIRVKTRAVENGWVEVVDGNITTDDTVFYDKKNVSTKRENRNHTGFR